MQLRENNSAGSSKRKSHSCSSDTQERHLDPIILLERIHILMSFLSWDTAINPDVFDLLTTEGSIKSIQHWLVMAEDDQLDVVLEQLQDILLGGL